MTTQTKTPAADSAAAGGREVQAKSDTRDCIDRTPITQSPRKPWGLAPVREGMPDELAWLPVWAPWVAIPSRTRAGKTDKVPTNGKGAFISTADATAWTDLDHAWRAYEALPQASGVTVCVNLTRECREIWGDPPMLFGDVDGCIQDGAVDPAVAALLRRLAVTSITLSPSGHGLRFLAIGEVPRDYGVLRVDGVKLELYAGYSPRHCTMTGRAVALPGVPS